MKTRYPGRVGALVGAAMLFVSACSTGGTTTATETPTTAAAAPSSDPCAALTVEGAWVRLPATDNSALYLTIVNQGDEDVDLVGASSDFAAAYSLHESVMEDGKMTMRPVEGGAMTAPAGGTLELRPGGLHVMVMGVDRPLAEGDETSWTLEFDNGCSLDVRAPVQIAEGMGAMSDMGGDDTGSGHGTGGGDG